MSNALFFLLFAIISIDIAISSFKKYVAKAIKPIYNQSYISQVCIINMYLAYAHVGFNDNESQEIAILRM